MFAVRDSKLQLIDSYKLIQALKKQQHKKKNAEAATPASKVQGVNPINQTEGFSNK